VGASLGPLVVEEAAAGEGGAHEPEVSAAGDEHGADGVVEFVGDLGGFVYQEEVYGGEAADGAFVGAGESEDSGVVGEDQGDIVDGSRLSCLGGGGGGRSRGPCGGVRRFGGLRGR
jgi:hypothetical protein